MTNPIENRMAAYQYNWQPGTQTRTSNPAAGVAQPTDQVLPAKAGEKNQQIGPRECRT